MIALLQAKYFWYSRYFSSLTLSNQRHEKNN
jgi:hypothetical protein